MTTSKKGRRFFICIQVKIVNFYFMSSKIPLLYYFKCLHHFCLSKSCNVALPISPCWVKWKSSAKKRWCLTFTGLGTSRRRSLPPLNGSQAQFVKTPTTVQIRLHLFPSPKKNCGRSQRLKSTKQTKATFYCSNQNNQNDEACQWN